jgi:hypothetical protein
LRSSAPDMPASSKNVVGGQRQLLCSKQAQCGDTDDHQSSDYSDEGLHCILQPARQLAFVTKGILRRRYFPDAR